MEKLYFVFDQIPSPQSGGLIGMYLNICEKLKNDYDIQIVVFIIVIRIILIYLRIIML